MWRRTKTLNSNIESILKKNRNMFDWHAKKPCFLENFLILQLFTTCAVNFQDFRKMFRYSCSVSLFASFEPSQGYDEKKNIFQTLLQGILNFEVRIFEKKCRTLMCNELEDPCNSSPISDIRNFYFKKKIIQQKSIFFYETREQIKYFFRSLFLS